MALCCWETDVLSPLLSTVPQPRSYDELLASVDSPVESLNVRGHFSDAQPRVVRWRDNLIRPGFFLRSCVRNSALGHVVQRLPAYFFKPIKSLKPNLRIAIMVE